MKYLLAILFFYCTIVANAQKISWLNAGRTQKDSISNGLINGPAGNICTDAAGNIYITGYTVVPVSLSGITIARSGYYIAKYTPSGKILWAKNFAAGGGLYYTLLSDHYSHLYLSGTISFFAKICGQAFSNPSGLTSFIAKLDTSADLVWLKMYNPADSNVYCVSTGIGNNGDIYQAGTFSVSATFGNVHLKAPGPLSSGSDHSNSIYFAAFDSGGNVLWAKQTNKTYSSQNGIYSSGYVNSLLVCSNNDICVTIHPYGTLTYDTATIGSWTSQYGIAAMRINRNGNLLWQTEVEPGNNSFSYIFYQSFPVSEDGRHNLWFITNYADSFIVAKGLSNGSSVSTIILKKYTQNGNFISEKPLTGQNGDTLLEPNFIFTKILPQKDGSAYVLANNGILNNQTPGEYFNKRLTLNKYDSNLNIICVPAVLSSDSGIFAFGYCQDDSGNLYMNGFYDENIKYRSTVKTGNGINNPFIAKINLNPVNFSLPDSFRICGSGADSVAIDAGPHDSILWDRSNIRTRRRFVTSAGEYSFTAFDNGCSVYKTITVTDSCTPTFFIPNAFSPNGDGLNDSFTVYGTFVSSININIYNQWGEHIYSGNAWDGNFRGLPAPVGVYLCMIDYTSQLDNRAITHHTTSLIRLVR